MFNFFKKLFQQEYEKTKKENAIRELNVEKEELMHKQVLAKNIMRLMEIDKEIEKIKNS